MESLRLDPPQPLSNMFEAEEDIELKFEKAKFTLAKGTLFQFNIAAMHRDVTQWGKNSDKFNPRRLDPANPAFKAPDGGDRHKAAWMPNLRGKHAYPSDKLAIMMSNVFGSMFIAAMPTLKVKNKNIPLTNILLSPMNDVFVTAELPLRIGRSIETEVPMEEEEKQLVHESDEE